MPVPVRLALLTLLLTGCPPTEKDSALPDDTGGDEPALPVCEAEDLPVLGACVGWTGEPTILEEGYRSTLTADGVVTATGVDLVGVACGEAVAHAGGALGNQPDFNTVEGRWVRFQDAAGVEYTVLFVGPDVVVPAVGEAVSLSYDWRHGWDTTHGSAVLSDASGVVALLSTEHEVPALVAPTGIAASAGEGVCQDETDCSESTDWHVEVSDGAWTVALAPGQEASVGGYRVTAGELTEITSWKTCSDGPSSMFVLAAARE